MPMALYLKANGFADLPRYCLVNVVATDRIAVAIARPTSLQALSNVFDAWSRFRAWCRRGDGSSVRLSNPLSSRAIADGRFSGLV
jgi:hypothetical protein